MVSYSVTPMWRKIGAVQNHFPETQGDPGRTAEDKGINDSGIRADFPENEKEDEDQDSGCQNRSTCGASSGEDTVSVQELF